MKAAQSETGWMLRGLLALFGLTYAMGTIYFLLGCLRWQSLSPTWPRASLPSYTCMFGLGAFSVAGASRWKRWGVYRLSLTWAATIAVNALFPSPTSLPAAVGGTLLVILFAVLVRRAWSRFQ